MPESTQAVDAKKSSPVRRSFSIDEFCERNGISRRLAYDEINAGRLRIKKAGRRSLITTEAEDAWLEALPSPAA
jgi:excisionase family DNA binding protein